VPIEVKAGRLSEQRNTGRHQSDLWPEWVAELVLYFHEHGLPAGTAGQDHLIATIATRLALRGHNDPARSTVQPTVRAVLALLRSHSADERKPKPQNKQKPKAGN
jgi:hypothetical protein